MSPDDACRLPTRVTADILAPIQQMLRGKRIAVVGLSADPSRPSHDVAAYLLSAGFEVIPVNPTATEILGRTCFPTLADVPGTIDVVNVFRRPEHLVEVAKQAIAVGARGIWLQQGLTSDDSRRLAAEAGIPFVEDRCIKVEHILQSRQTSPG